MNSLSNLVLEKIGLRTKNIELGSNFKEVSISSQTPNTENMRLIQELKKLKKILYGLCTLLFILIFCFFIYHLKGNSKSEIEKITKIISKFNLEVDNPKNMLNKLADTIEKHSQKSDKFFYEVKGDISEINSKIHSIMNNIPKVTNSMSILSKNDAIKEGNKFISLCISHQLTNPTKYNINEHPLISVIMPVYNGAKYILSALTSIRNQKMKNIEIIIVNDNSTDNTLQIIQNLKLEEPRIRILSNDKNRGPLGTTYVGTKEANGKYVIFLDHDDLFINENLFDFLYNQAEANNFDIIEFSGFKNNFRQINYLGEEIFHPHKDGIVVYQPELSSFMYREDPDKIYLNDLYYWGKLIKADILKKAFDKIAPEISNNYVLFFSDVILLLPLFKIAKSYKFIKYFGIFKYESPNSVVRSDRKAERYKNDHIFYLEILLKFTRNVIEDKEILMNEINEYWQDICFFTKYETVKERAKNFYNIIMNDTLINQSTKNKMKNICDPNY